MFKKILIANRGDQPHSGAAASHIARCAQRIQAVSPRWGHSMFKKILIAKSRRPAAIDAAAKPHCLVRAAHTGGFSRDRGTTCLRRSSLRIAEKSPVWVIRTARALGYRTVAVYSDADRDA